MIYFITGVKRVCMVLILSSTFFRNSKQVRAFSLKKEAKFYSADIFVRNVCSCFQINENLK